ncbi:hypothetical protein EKO04_006006 [Ascochyta lentis]|uniref:Uncharacterized protein n=1 Tax=Ascochyta lentis TaxID=205686 RepID=A0A8H7MI25_9PLEO|nr:hypothetical protein EKO04_006006 [Ascochyta lentis]
MDRLLAQTSSGTKSADQQMNATDDPRTTANDDTDSNIRAPRAAAVPGHDLEMTRSATASALSEVGTQWEGNQDESNTEVREDKSKHPQENKKDEEQADSVQDDSRNVDDSVEEVSEVHTTPKRLPPDTSGPSLTDPTRVNLVVQTEKYQLSPSLELPWNPAGSPLVSRPGSANQSITSGILSHTNSELDLRPRRGEENDGPLHEPEGSLSAFSEAESQHDETGSQTELDRAGLITNNVSKAPDLNESFVHVASKDMDLLKTMEESIEPECGDLQNTNEYLQEKLHQADEQRHSLRAETVVLQRDIDHPCTAWLKACSAASVNADAIAHFQFLATDSQVDIDSRTAAHKELIANELFRQISDWQKQIRTLHAPEDWRRLYEEERQRNKTLQAQYNLLKTEAERMYQPDLERTCRDLKADLVDAQERDSSLSDELRKAQEQEKAWKTEAEQSKQELELRMEQFDEQTRLQNKEMTDVVKEYRSKINDSENWDKDGMATKNKRLEHDQAMLVAELRRVSRTSAIKDDQIEELFKRQQHDQRVIEDMHRACLTGRTADIKPLSTQDAIKELREKQRLRRGDEDAKDALKEKVRQLRMKNLYPPHKDRWYDVVQAEWQTRWGVGGTGQEKARSYLRDGTNSVYSILNPVGTDESGRDVYHGQAFPHL